MEPRHRTWFDDSGLVIAGASGAPDRRLPFYAGAMHYWRVDPARWARGLAAIHDLGLTIVETYVPWRVHEPAPGQLRWDRERDLARFLEAAHAAGLAVVLRPGPHINAELTSFGIPDHVLADPACQARTASGTPVWLPSLPRAWPVPSYASAVFRDRVHAWYAALARVIAPLVAPAGPVVALGVDNEAQMFFRLGAYDQDYHPDAIAAWREASGLDGDPPRAWQPAAAARCISWVRFKDQYVAHALGAFARSFDEVGLGQIARFHNLPAGPSALSDLRGIQRAIAGPVGIDAHTRRPELRALRQRAIAAVGNAAPLPIAFEAGVGYAAWLPPLDAGDDPQRERDQLLTLLAAGIRGFNLYMAVERDRFYGAAIDRDGAVEPHAAWIRPLLAALAELGWPALRRHAAAAVIETRADARFGHASCAIDPVTPAIGDLLDLGPSGAAELGRDPDAVIQRRWQAAVTRALDLARVPHAILDESASEAELASYRAVIVPTLDRIDRGLAHTLRAVAEHPAVTTGAIPTGAPPAGGSPATTARALPAGSPATPARASAASRRRTVVVIGPGTPTHDELGQPLPADALPRRVGRLKAGSLDDVPGLAADLAALAGEPSDAWQIERPDEVHAYAHADDRGTVRVVFVASDLAKPATAVLLVDDGARALRDPFSHERVVASDGRAAITLPPRGVRMLIVDR